jgi:hypothetical protein
LTEAVHPTAGSRKQKLMDRCEDIAGLLPWLLNGTLEAAEAQAVRAHLAQCSACQRELEETAVAWLVGRQHAPTGLLLDYAFAEPIAELYRAPLERHVAACQQCSEELEMARASRQWAETAERETSLKVVQFPLRPRRAQLWQYGALAACLALFFALGGWLLAARRAQNEQARSLAQERQLREQIARLESENRQLQQTSEQQLNSKEAELQARLRELNAPQANVSLFDLYPRELARRAAATTINEITLPRAAKTVTLILNSQSEARAASLTISNAQGAVVWRAARLTRQAAGEYTLSLPVEFLPPGRYTFKLEAQQPGRRVVSESFDLRLRRAER